MLDQPFDTKNHNRLKWPLVYIAWVDSFGAGHSWASLDDVKDVRHVCYSVGWLVADGENVKVLVPHISPEHSDIGAENSGCGDMAIPCSAIIDLRVIAECVGWHARPFTACRGKANNSGVTTAKSDNSAVADDDIEVQ